MCSEGVHTSHRVIISSLFSTCCVLFAPSFFPFPVFNSLFSSGGCGLFDIELLHGMLFNFLDVIGSGAESHIQSREVNQQHYYCKKSHRAVRAKMRRVDLSLRRYS